MRADALCTVVTECSGTLGSETGDGWETQQSLWINPKTVNGRDRLTLTPVK